MNHGAGDRGPDAAGRRGRGRRSGGARRSAAGAKQAHDILLGGATDYDGLKQIVEDAVRVHLDAPGRVAIRGPHVEIGAKAALPIILMLHEFATNAAKYGALSNGEGRISISWSVTGRIGAERLRLQWQETGGPVVVAPSTNGFGSRLIERGLAGQLGAEVKLDYRPEGVTCDLDAPMGRVRETS